MWRSTTVWRGPSFDAQASILHRQRTRNGLSLPEAARRLGAKSPDAYARYERGDSCPTLEKLSELMAAISPGCDFVLQRGTAREIAA